MQTDYAGQTIEIVDPETGEIHETQIFVTVLGASSYILDRNVHNTHRIDLKGESMQRKNANLNLTTAAADNNPD